VQPFIIKGGVLKLRRSVSIFHLLIHIIHRGDLKINRGVVII